MSNKRRVEVFSAGCSLCEAAIETVRAVACDSCEVTVQDMTQADAEARARALGVKSVPAVAIDGELAACCTGGGIDEQTLRKRLFRFYIRFHKVRQPDSRPTCCLDLLLSRFNFLR